MNDKWLSKLNSNPLPWLLEYDPENPGVRYFAIQEFNGLNNII